MKNKYEKELEQILKKLKSNNKEDFELFYNNYNNLVYKIAITVSIVNSAKNKVENWVKALNLK